MLGPGAIIRATRKIRGMRIQELASKSGVSVSTIQRIENCVPEVEWSTLRTVAAALQLQFDVVTRTIAIPRDLTPDVIRAILPKRKMSRSGIQKAAAVSEALKRSGDIPDAPESLGAAKESPQGASQKKGDARMKLAAKRIGKRRGSS